MSAFVRYTLARLGFFVVTFVVLGGLSTIWLEWNAVTGLWVALISLVISAIAALIFLRGMRDEVALALKARSDKMHERFEAARSAEDVD